MRSLLKILIAVLLPSFLHAQSVSVPSGSHTTYVIGANTIPYSATPVIDPSTGNVQQFTCTTGAASISPTTANLSPGIEFNFIFIQNSGTACTLTFPSNIHGAATVSSTLNSVNVFKFVVTLAGTDAYQISSTAGSSTPSAPSGTAYFMSASGSDANNGTSSGTPWLSPNHAVNCGDTITAAASTSYSAANFAIGKWGTVTGTGHCVAWVICVTFDACKVSSSSQTAFQVSANHWGIQGWEATTTSSSTAACFFAEPPNSSTSVHDIIFANDIANGCQNGGFSAIYNGSAGTDYIVYVGNIAYNAVQQGPGCASGLNIVNPVASDTTAGTHLYVAGNFAWANVDGATCAGSTATDGEGFILDSAFTNAYAQQVYVSNNIFVGNGGRGIEVYKNNGTPAATVYIKQNTLWDNQTQSGQTPGGNLGEFYWFQSKNINASGNIAKTNQTNGPQSHPYYAYDMNTGDGSSTVAGNDGFSAAGNNFLAQFGTGFAYGTNLTTDPAFSSASVPGAPSCGSASSVANCMATVISNFAPTGGGLSSYGYQAATSANAGDALFPSWLCGVNLPSGLITQSCAP